MDMGDWIFVLVVLLAIVVDIDGVHNDLMGLKNNQNYCVPYGVSRSNI